LRALWLFQELALFPDLRAVITCPGAIKHIPVLTVNEPQTLAQLRRQRLTPYLYSLLMAAGRENSVSPAVLNCLEADYAWALKQNLDQQQETRKILKALNGAGIEAILLKGADLRLRLYPEAAARPMNDLDLLIGQKQYPEARRVLEHLGYRLSPFCAEPRPGFRERFENELFFNPPPGKSLGLDLHWEIRSGAGYYRLPTQDLQARAQGLVWAGLPVKVLAPEHALMHLCLHLLEDPYGLIPVLDLALLLRSLPVDWPFFLEEAESFHCGVPVGLVLSQLAPLLPESIPPPVMAALGRVRPGFPEKLIFSNRWGSLSHYLAVWHHYSLPAGLAYLAAKLWPDRAYLAATQGNVSRLAYLGQFFPRAGAQSPNGANPLSRS
jgi:hypothetical protein